MREGIHTLRGTIPVVLGGYASYGAATLKNIFRYQSPDQTRAWRVRYAAVWLQETFTGTGGGDTRALLNVSLCTDSLTADGEPSIISNQATARAWQRTMSPDDNRTIAWVHQDYHNRDATSADFIVPTSGATPQAAFITDFERLVTNELWLAVFSVTESTEVTLDMAYYIELEQMKITPSESVLQILKGQGQDVGGPLLVEDTT